MVFADKTHHRENRCASTCGTGADELRRVKARRNVDGDILGAANHLRALLVGQTGGAVLDVVLQHVYVGALAQGAGVDDRGAVLEGDLPYALQDELELLVGTYETSEIEVG